MCAETRKEKMKKYYRCLATHLAHLSLSLFSQIQKNKKAKPPGAGGRGRF
jgi:hypothetical protein